MRNTVDKCNLITPSFGGGQGEASGAYEASVLHPLTYEGGLPERFTFPFCYQPHPTAEMAARIVQLYIKGKEEWREELGRGKMFGVLVVRTEQGETGFLAAYSGLLDGRNDHEYFVPPVFDSQQPQGHFKTQEQRISALSRANRPTRHYSIALQRWLFRQYNLLNINGEERNILDIFSDYYSASKAYERKLSGIPPSGTGDCCAPKLLQYAFLNRLRPVCMAEFWYGESPKGEIRHHLQYYPACSGKCKPLLAFMLKGMALEPNPQELAVQGELKIVYEDEEIIVVDKPAGMPSVPGKIDVRSALEILEAPPHPSPLGEGDNITSAASLNNKCNQNPLPLRGEDGRGLLQPVHRLDMATSGLLLFAKSEAVHKTLQGMFARKEVRKEYAAVLSLPQVTIPHSIAANLPCEISLPLAADALNRPYQRVDHEHGKEAITIIKEVRTVDIEGKPRPLVILSPLTGRTHQLRVHCAHSEGLGTPILGDELYGSPSSRLYLHSQRLSFRHPATGKEMQFYSPPPFV